MKRLAVLLCVFTLAACSEGEHAELQRWMAESAKDIVPGIPKLPQVRPYEPVPYEVAGQVDPFRPSKIDPENKGRPGGARGGLQPNFEAREQRNNVLEKYPLESLKMIGYLNVNNRPIGVVLVDGKTRQIKIGQYMGMDFGMVTAISDTEIKLKELVQDSAGDWSERESSLFLQGKEESRK